MCSKCKCILEVELWFRGQYFCLRWKLYWRSKVIFDVKFLFEVNIQSWSQHLFLSSISTLKVNINYRIWSSNFIFEVKIHFSGQTFVSKSIFILKVKIYSWGQNLFSKSEFILEIEVDFWGQILILRPNLILRIYWIYYLSNIRHFQAAETRFFESNLNLSILWNVQLPSCNKVNLDAILSLENSNSDTSIKF